VDNTYNLLADLKDALGASVTPSLTTSSATSDLFEAYVFGILLQAARDQGAQLVTFEDVDGMRPTTFVFRTSPGYIYSREQPYCHAVIEFAGKPALEAHVGIRVQGSSGVLHECDIAVLRQTEAVLCRRQMVQPRQSKVIIAVECKFYSATIPLGLARGFVGLVSDVAQGDRYFIVNTNSNQAEKYLTARKRSWEHEVYPGSLIAVARLRNAFQVSFRNFVAAN
jgi:hypothetical protein